MPDVARAPELSAERAAVHFPGNVTFRYGGYDTPLFSGLEVHIAAGERVGLVSAIPALGKTTFIA